VKEGNLRFPEGHLCMLGDHNLGIGEGAEGIG